MSWAEQTAAICNAINALRQTVASEYHNAGGERANEYISEAKILIETAFDVLRREDKWARKQPRLAPRATVLH